MKKIFFAAALAGAAMLASCGGGNADGVQKGSLSKFDSLSYALGANIGYSLGYQMKDIPFDAQLIRKGVEETALGKSSLSHDDALETLLLCLLHEGRIHTFHPKSYLSRMDLTVIRPMVYVPEKHVIHVARELNLPVVASSCPANGNTQREEMKALLDRLCKTYPNARELMLSALQNEDQYGLWNRPHKP